jgi:hypothetical protein
MCHFITGTLSPNCDLEAAREIIYGRGFGFELINNPFVQPQLMQGESYISLTRHVCDCGTVLGSAAGKGRKRGEHFLQRETEKLQRQKWGEAKITRWLEEKRDYETRKDGEKENYLQHSRMSAERWVELVQTFITVLPKQHLGILLHWYRSSVLNEHIQIMHRSISLPGVMPELFLDFQEDMLYRFHS